MRYSEMLKVYVYCSYRSSPVGFAIGAVDYDGKNSEDYLIPTLKCATNNAVKGCFENDLINKAYGKLPQESRYIYVIKSLECDFTNEDGMPSKKYGNFAFETTDAKVYNDIANNIQNISKNKLCGFMNKFLIPDSNVVDLALKLDAKAFREFMNELLSDTNGSCDDNFIVETLPYKTDYSSKLSQILGFNMFKKNERMYEFKKKIQSQHQTSPLKKVPTWLKILIAIIAAPATIKLLIWIVKKLIQVIMLLIKL